MYIKVLLVFCCCNLLRVCFCISVLCAVVVPAPQDTSASSWLAESEAAGQESRYPVVAPEPHSWKQVIATGKALHKLRMLTYATLLY